MKKYIAILSLIYLASTCTLAPANAYDDEESTYKLAHCMVDMQKKYKFTNNMALAQTCRKENQDFMRYNCAPGETMTCVGLVFQMAAIVQQNWCEKTKGCSVAGR
jgi:hypothetical protein